MQNFVLALLMALSCFTSPAIATTVCDPEVDYVILEGTVGGCTILTIGLCCEDSFMECYGEVCHGSWQVSCY